MQSETVAVEEAAVAATGEEQEGGQEGGGLGGGGKRSEVTSEVTSEVVSSAVQVGRAHRGHYSLLAASSQCCAVLCCAVLCARTCCAVWGGPSLAAFLICSGCPPPPPSPVTAPVTPRPSPPTRHPLPHPSLHLSPHPSPHPCGTSPTPYTGRPPPVTTSPILQALDLRAPTEDHSTHGTNHILQEAHGFVCPVCLQELARRPEASTFPTADALVEHFQACHQ
jgi:hypothetical protein